MRKNRFAKFLSCLSAAALALSAFPVSMLSSAEEANQANEEISPPAYQEEAEQVDIFSVGDNITYASTIVLQNYQRFEGCELEFTYKVLETFERNGKKADPSHGETYIDCLEKHEQIYDEDRRGYGWVNGGFHADLVDGTDDTYTIKMNVDSVRNPYNDDYSWSYSHAMEFRFDNVHLELLSAKANGMDILVNDIYASGACLRETTYIEHIEDYAGQTLTATFETYKDFKSKDEMLKYFNTATLGSWVDTWWNYQMNIAFMPGDDIDLIAKYAGLNKFTVELPVPDLSEEEPDKPLFPNHLRMVSMFTPIAKLTGLTVPSKTFQMYFMPNGAINRSLQTQMIVKPGDEVYPVDNWDGKLNNETMKKPGYKFTGFCTEKECPHKQDDADQTGHICWAIYDEDGYNLNGTTPYKFDGNSATVCYAQWELGDNYIEMKSPNGGSFEYINDDNEVSVWKDSVWLHSTVLSEQTIEDYLESEWYDIVPPEGKIFAGLGYWNGTFDKLKAIKSGEFDDETVFEYNEPYLVYRPDEKMGKVLKDELYTCIWPDPLVPVWADSEEDAEKIKLHTLEEFYIHDDNNMDYYDPNEELDLNVLYDVDGGRFSSHIYGEVWNVIPRKTGYTFDGWYRDRKFTEKFEFDDNGRYYFTDDDFKNFDKSNGHKTFTLYSKWNLDEENNPQYTLKFDANGGTGDEAEVDIDFQTNTYWTVAKPTVTAPAKKSFLNWNTKADGSGISYKVGEKVPMTDLLASLANDKNVITLYAVWANSDISEDVENLNTVDVEGDETLAAGDEFVSLNVEPVQAVGDSNADSVKKELDNAVKNTDNDGCKDADVLSSFEASLNKFDKDGKNGETLNNLDKDVEITVDIGYVPAEKIPFAMHMLADGTVERCKTVFDGITHKLKIKTKSFSPYVIATADRPDVYFYDPEPGSKTLAVNDVIKKVTVNDTGIIGEKVDVQARDGYNFLGWYISENDKITDSDKPFDPEKDYVTMELNVYAKWVYPHTLTHVEAVKADCVKDGNIEYWVCKDEKCGCGKKYSDKDGKTEVTTVAVKAAGHKYADGKCTVCGTADPDYKPVTTATTTTTETTTTATETTTTTTTTEATVTATETTTAITTTEAATTATETTTAATTTEAATTATETTTAVTTTKATTATETTTAATTTKATTEATTEATTTTTTAATTIPTTAGTTTVTTTTVYYEPVVTKVNVDLRAKIIADLKEGEEFSVKQEGCSFVFSPESVTMIKEQLGEDKYLSFDYGVVSKDEIKNEAVLENIEEFDAVLSFELKGSEGNKIEFSSDDGGKAAVKVPYAAPVEAKKVEVYGISEDGTAEKIGNAQYDPKTKTIAFDTANYEYYAVKAVDENGEAVKKPELPQTGNNVPDSLIIVISAMMITLTGAWVTIKSGIIRRKKEN